MGILDAEVSGVGGGVRGPRRGRRGMIVNMIV